MPACGEGERIRKEGEIKEAVGEGGVDCEDE